MNVRLELAMYPKPDDNARERIEQWVEFIEEHASQMKNALENPEWLKDRNWEEATSHLL